MSSASDEVGWKASERTWAEGRNHHVSLRHWGQVLRGLELLSRDRLGAPGGAPAPHCCHDSQSPHSTVPLHASHTPQLPLEQHSTVLPLCLLPLKAQPSPAILPATTTIALCVHSLLTPNPPSLAFVQLRHQRFQFCLFASFK